MSKPADKGKHSKRLYNDAVKIDKQVAIAKAHGLVANKPHAFGKMHATNCGIPNCVMCGNPRKIWCEKTMQERKFDETIGWTE